MFIFLIVSDLLMLRYNKQRATLRAALCRLFSVCCDYARMPFAWRQALIATAEKPRTMIATNT